MVHSKFNIVNYKEKKSIKTISLRFRSVSRLRIKIERRMRQQEKEKKRKETNAAGEYEDGYCEKRPPSPWQRAIFFLARSKNGIRSTPNGTTPQRAAFISQFSNWPPGTKKNQTKKTNKKNKQTNKRKTTIESDAPKWMERNGTKWNGMNEMKRSSNDDPAETNANGKPCNALQTLG